MPMQDGLIIFEDEHLLVVDKPAGWNTHAPAPFAGEGVFDWLRHREPRWAKLAIIHRLDKETSGALVFAKTPLANRSLTEQFTEHSARKRYVLLTDRPLSSFPNAGVAPEFTIVSEIVRAGDHYQSRPLRPGGVRAETRFRGVTTEDGGCTRLEAEPITGRTHQIRVHAAANGFPILGDVRYGGTLFHRVALHARELVLRHPATGQDMSFTARPDFSADARLTLRRAVIDPEQTNAYRLVHGASDQVPGLYVDQLGDFMLVQSEQAPTPAELNWLRALAERESARGLYHKRLNRHVRQTKLPASSPLHVWGAPAPDEFQVRENGLKFALRFGEGYSVGLFLDQRDNRRRLLANHIAAGFPLFPSGARGATVLNTFAYTCGFSVCAARAGARVVSLDLSKKYLDWGRRNFALNELDPAVHEFIFGDTFDWLRRFAKKGRHFDAILLDPPTFSQSKEHGRFQAARDYDRLVTAAARVLRPGGVLFASTNAAELAPEQFLEMVNAGPQAANRTASIQHYVPQPPDFPITREEPAYLKTVWLRVG